MEEEVTDKLIATSETQAEQVATDAEKVVTPSASTQDATAGRKQRNRRMKDEDRTSPVAAVLDQGHDEMCGDFNEEPETPYGTPDETASEEPALPAKRCRRDATTVDATVEETLAASAQRLEPQWMVSRSARDKKGKRASTQRSTSLTREGEATQ
ncbi:hypothetical protein MTO96_036785 [Rhipicephalus appendiculatus]